MTTFRRYDHIERLGNDEVEGIELGEVWVFPKLDGTNASVWAGPGGEAYCGSRNRRITPLGDNHGFAAWATQDQRILDAVKAMDQAILYGEWLVPHTFKAYREDVWKRFWIFDVWDRSTSSYLSFDTYGPALSTLGLDVIDPLWKATNPSDGQLRAAIEGNTYLVMDGQGVGEGVVIKRYDWRNRFGRQPWAKVVRNEFKEDNLRAFGVAERSAEYQPELDLAQRAVTPALVAKERARLEGNNVPRASLIPALLGSVYHAVVTEELWSFVKKGRVTLDFSKLQRAVVAETKRAAEDLF